MLEENEMVEEYVTSAAGAALAVARKSAEEIKVDFMDTTISIVAFWKRSSHEFR
jgi:hypothetical protein